ncbi:uncharacterized protein LOC120068823 [Benincasa hispida]|uniref:uncharacterized protein LOC120068823 n=1 Tax=Benincasa hispida TaxID=102211 RepID=UPI0018FF37C7|nr:uncharacterized protein LOC120068823 [Benincasa hispida]
MAQSRKKSYVDVRRKNMEFEIADKVFLKVAPMKGVLRFGKKDSSHVVDYEPLHLNENLSYEEKLIQILAREVKVLHNKEIALVKVLWWNHQFEEASGSMRMT